MRVKITAAAILFLGLTGGMMAYSSPFLYFFLFATLILIIPQAIAAALLFKADPPAYWPAITLFLAALISGLANLDIAGTWFGRVYWGFISIGVLFIAAAHLSSQDIFTALRRVGLAWPPLWLAATMLGWSDHRNITPFYALIGGLALLASGRRWLVIPSAVLLLYLDSRGALLAALAGALVLFWPVARRYWRYGAPVAVVLLPVLYWLRPGTAAIRLDYWRAALASLAWPTSIWYGLGPAGLWARQIIPEGDGWQIHAHNIFVTTLAETGLLGMLALAAAGAMLANMRFTRWQAAIGAGLAVWSLVDEPLFWPGPLFTTALVFSSLTWRNLPAQDVVN